MKGGLYQPSARLLCTSFTYCIQWLSQCETLISSKHHPVDSPNWVNQRWSTENRSRERSEKGFQYASSFFATLCTDHCKHTGRGSWTLRSGAFDYKERVSWWPGGDIAYLAAFSFGSDISLHNSPFSPRSEKRNSMVKCEKGTCVSSTFSAVASRETCDSSASCPLLCILIHRVWRRAAAIRGAQYTVIFFSLGFIGPLQDEILHQDFTDTFIFKAHTPPCHLQLTSIKFKQSTSGMGLVSAHDEYKMTEITIWWFKYRSLIYTKSNWHRLICPLYCRITD